MRNFYKHPVETYPIGIDYTGKAPEGATLVSGTWSAIDTYDQQDASDDVLQGASAVIAGMVAKCRVQGGTLTRTYLLRLAATFDTGDVLHDQITMHVDVTG